MNRHLIKIVFIIPLFVVSVFSQDDGIDYEKLSQRYYITHEKDGILKLECKLTGKTTFKTENIKHIPSDYEFDLIIDLRTIDTTQYSDLFTFWSEIPIGSSLPVRIADANNDNRKELYASYVVPPNFTFDYVIFEINKNGSFDSVFNYPENLGGIWCFGDLENDGFLETANSSLYSDSLGFYLNILTIDPLNGYPTIIKTIYNPTKSNGQPVDANFYDMDGDEYSEMIYYLNGTGDSLVLSNSFHIAKYDRTNNEFNLIYQNRPSQYTIHTRGFTFGDFDSDGKQNFAVSNFLGEVFIYEHIEKNIYDVIRIDSLPISNVYLQHFTNDLDRNGKPELWIGGEGYINGVGSTILYIYEADGDDQYNVVYTIALIGVISFFASNMVSADIDNNGIDEVLLCIDQHLLIFKNKKSVYELYYIKRNEYLNQNSVFYSATTADFDKDKYAEIVVSMDLIENNIPRLFSRTYKKTSTLDVSDEIDVPNNYYLSEAYPNPFNPSTTFSFVIGHSSLVKLKVYDILGREVKALLNEYMKSGKYQITWNGTDNYGNRVSSGTYFINMVLGEFNKSIKTVLVK
jgi:hypothetical protein